MSNVKSKDFFSRAEKSLRESEAQKKAILDASIDRIRLIDRDMRILWANKTTTRELNVSPEDLVGKFCYHVFVGRDSPCPECPTKKALKSGNIEHAILHQPYQKGIEGETYWDIYTVPIKNESGDIVNLIQITRNITEKVQAEKALQEREEKWRSLAETAPCIILTVQRDGTIQFLNRPVGNYTPEDTIGTKVWDYVPPDHHSVIQKAIEHVFQTGFPISYEILGAGVEGPASAWYMTQLGPILKDGEVVAVTMVSTDITEIKKVHEELGESEAQKKAILDASVDRIRLVDTDMRVIWANKTTTRELNIAPEDLVGQPCYKILYDRDAPCAECPSKKTLTSGNIEHTIMHQPYSKGIEGETYWDSYSVPIKNESGDIVNLIQITRNITEQVRREQELRESEEKYRSLVDSTEDSIYLLDRNCTYLFINKKHLSRLGLAAEKATGRTYAEFHTEDDTKELIEKVEKLFETGKSLLYEYRSKRDGRYFLRTLSPVKEPDGKTISVTVVSKDITEQKQIEEALRESEEKWRRLFEDSRDAIYIAKRNGEYVDVNQSFLDLFGYTREEAINSNDVDRYINPIDRVRFTKEIIQKGSVKDYELKLRKKNGAEMDCLSTATVRRANDGSILGYQGIIRDITERKRTEQAIKEREAELEVLNKQLEENNRALSVLARNLDITRRESEKRIIQRTQNFVMPIIEKLRQDKNLERYKTDFDLLIEYVRDLTSDLANDIKIPLSLSATELRVASLVKNGMPSQEIAKHLYVSASTVMSHRKNIRRKLDLHNSGINLKAYLESKLDQR